MLAPALVNTIMSDLGLNEGLGGLIQLVYFAGALMGVFAITRLLQKFSMKQVLLLQVPIVSGSLLAAAAAPNFGLLLVFYSLTGFANGILVTAPGTYVTGMAGSDAPRLQTILCGFLSLGFVLGPVLPGFIARWDISWRWALVVPAVLIVPLATPLAAKKMERMKEMGTLSIKVLRDAMAFNRSLFFGLLIAILLYASAKSSVNMWLVRFLERGEGFAPGMAHIVLVGLAVSITVGRWVLGALSKRIDPFRILMVITFASTVIVFLAPLPTSKIGSSIMYPLLGFLYAGILPFLVGYAAWFPSSDSSAVFSSLIAAGMVGGAIFPYVIGLLNQFIGPRWGMSSVSILMAGVFACIFWIKPHILKGPGEPGLLPENVAVG